MSTTTSNNFEQVKTQVICELYDIGAVKFGSFVLKSGLTSPVYIDLRIIPSFPKLFSNLIQLLVHIGEQNNLLVSEKDHRQLFLCGVPYSALTFASVVAAEKHLPSIIVRKEQKTYGTKNMVEGTYAKNDRVLILEDVMTSGASILETVEKIEAEGLDVENVIVLLNRQQNVRSAGLQFELNVPQAHQNRCAKKSYSVTACVTLQEVVDVLLRENKIDITVADSIRNYIAENKITEQPEKAPQAPPATITPPKELSFEQRAQLPKANRFSKRLFNLMAEKKTNLCLSADLTDPVELLRIIDQVGSEICMLKTHMDIVHIDTSKQQEVSSYEDLINRIVQLSEKHNFVIFEDRKFADIGNTVQHQYEHGPFSICKWAHLTNTHLVSGLSSVKALQQTAQKYEQSDANIVRGCLVLAEMSTEDSLYSKAEFKQYFLQLSEQAAEQCSDFVSGFICQGRFITDSNKGAHLLYCTPGVNINASADGLGQIYNSPERVISELKSDVIIVGRGIYHSSQPQQSASEFRDRAWRAYEQRLQQ